MKKKKCGYIAILGRPNVGKSTLLNKMLNYKVSITSRKPQTTRHQIMGVNTTENTQFIYVDTPGLHQIENKAINRFMNKAASSVIHDVDVILLLTEALKWTELEDWILGKLKHVKVPVILVVNKADQVKPKNKMLPYLAKITQKFQFKEIIAVSAKYGQQLDILEKLIESDLPESDFYYKIDQVTDRSEKFLVAEIIREKLMRSLGDELPYQLTVEIESFKFDEIKKIYDISANILVERNAQKAMVIGKQGEKIKQIGIDARKDVENLLNSRIYLQLWVKVKAGWSDDDRALKSLGYDS